MSTAELKNELKHLIDSEGDSSLLEAIHTMLTNSSQDDLLKIKLTSRALKSESDIREGKVMDRSEFEKRLRERISG